MSFAFLESLRKKRDAMLSKGEPSERPRQARSSALARYRSLAVRATFTASLAFCALFWTVAQAQTESSGIDEDRTISEELSAALTRGDCVAAGTLSNRAIAGLLPESLRVVATMFSDGRCVNPDQQRAARYIAAAAREGSPGAARELAIRYGLGVGVEQNYALAGEWFEHTDVGRSLSLALADAERGYVLTVLSIAQQRFRSPMGIHQDGTIWLRMTGKSLDVELDPHQDYGDLRAIDKKLIAAAIVEAWNDARSQCPPPGNMLIDDRTLLFRFILSVR